jgi:hypothetical protein
VVQNSTNVAIRAAASSEFLELPFSLRPLRLLQFLGNRQRLDGRQKIESAKSMRRGFRSDAARISNRRIEQKAGEEVMQHVGSGNKRNSVTANW